MEIVEDEQQTKYKLGEFEGPLDLLLFLIKKNEVNIYDIPISSITEQYLEFLTYATKVDLDNITDFYVLASTLLYIKSRMLLPIEVDIDEELEDPRQELVERLIEYQKYKKLSLLMREKEQASEWIFERKKKQRILPFPENEELWQRVEVWDLLKTFSGMVQGLSSERIIDLFEEVSINEKIIYLHELMETNDEIAFTDLLVKKTSVMEIVCSFLAVLELVKVKQIMIFQHKLFGTIKIKRKVNPEHLNDIETNDMIQE